ncbi:MAG: glycerol kinase [Cytophagales bacterium]|nr:MAG: glycerol kinase [Cytophagales bacterium]
MSSYIIALDQGTTSSRAVLIDEKAQIVGIEQLAFTQYFPEAGWVEHDAQEIWESQQKVLLRLIEKHKIAPTAIKAIGITNQRETTILWDKKTSQPIAKAIVWQDRRTADFCTQLKEEGWESYIQQSTGLIVDAYFSATKVHWLLENIPNAKEKAQKGELCFGTVDTWLLWKLTEGRSHYTDHTNASRTMLYDIRKLQWDTKLLEKFDIPTSLLPEVKPSRADFGYWQYEGHAIPILALAGDQQAALFGQFCWEKGTAKNTYGTGCFILMNVGETAPFSYEGLVTTLACGLNETPLYALEGSIFIAGAAIQWLRDSLHLIDNAEDADYFAQKAPEDHQVYFVPAFVGLGAPHWDMYARGALYGLTRDSDKNTIIRAALESIAYQTRDVLEAMRRDTQILLSHLKVDGGASKSNFLMQFQADILNKEVIRTQTPESTALGVAYLAGLQAQLWTPNELIKNYNNTNKVFSPTQRSDWRSLKYRGWKKAIKKTKTK